MDPIDEGPGPESGVVAIGQHVRRDREQPHPSAFGVCGEVSGPAPRLPQDVCEHEGRVVTDPRSLLEVGEQVRGRIVEQAQELGGGLGHFPQEPTM